MMRAGDDTGMDAFSDPGAIDEIANLSCNAHQVSGFHTDAPGIDRMYPDGIVVRYLIQPPGIAGACMDERGQAKRGDEQVFAAFGVNSRTMDMAAHITGNGIFGPTPFLH